MLKNVVGNWRQKTTYGSISSLKELISYMQQEVTSAVIEICMVTEEERVREDLIKEMTHELNLEKWVEPPQAGERSILDTSRI